MKILVPIKRVPDPTAKVKIKDGHIDLAGASWIVNTFDEYAVETALRLVENGADNTRLPGGEIVRIYGIVSQVRARHEGARFDSDVFLIEDGVLPAEKPVHPVSLIERTTCSAGQE